MIGRGNKRFSPRAAAPGSPPADFGGFSCSFARAQARGVSLACRGGRVRPGRGGSCLDPPPALAAAALSRRCATVAVLALRVFAGHGSPRRPEPTVRCTRRRCRGWAGSRSGPGSFPVALVARPPPASRPRSGSPRGRLLRRSRSSDDWRGVRPARAARGACGGGNRLAAAFADRRPAGRPWRGPRPSSSSLLSSCGPRTSTTSWTAAMASRRLMALCGFAAYAAAAAHGRASRGRSIVALAAASRALPRRQRAARPRRSWATSAPCRSASLPRRSGRRLRRGAWPAWFPLLVFLPFIADASVTLVRRLLRGRARGRGAPIALLPAAPSAGRGHRRHACDLWRA